MFSVVDNSVGAAGHISKPLGTLTEAHITAITLGLESNWSIDQIVDCNEQLSLMLTPPTSRNLDVVFHIDRDEHGLNLSLMQGDELHDRGSYEDVTALLSSVCFTQNRNTPAEFALRRPV